MFEYAAAPDPAIRIITKGKLVELRLSLGKFIKTAADSANYRNPQMLAQMLDSFNLTSEKFIPVYTVNFKIKQR